MKSLISLIVFLFSNIISNAQSDANVGCYLNNFAVVGWFATSVELKADSTFEYLQRGDLMNDRASGIYRVEGNMIRLEFDIPTLDSIYFVFQDSTGASDSILFPGFRNQYADTRPTGLLKKGNRLYTIFEENKVDKYRINARERKQKYFLVKTNEYCSENW